MPLPGLLSAVSGDSTLLGARLESLQLGHIAVHRYPGEAATGWHFVIRH